MSNGKLQEYPADIQEAIRWKCRETTRLNRPTWKPCVEGGHACKRCVDYALPRISKDQGA